MEVLTSFVAAIVAKTGQLLCQRIYSYAKDVVQFPSNLKDLTKQRETLINLRNDIENQLESAKKEGRSPTSEVKKWLREVHEFDTKVDLIQAGKTAEGKRLCSCFCRYGKCAQLSRDVEEMLKEAERLLKFGSPRDGLLSSVHYSEKPIDEKVPQPVEYIPGPWIEGQTTASRTLAELMRILDDDCFQRIGVWGMGGPGKTTLVKNLNKQLNTASSNHPFSIVIWARVSKDLDMKRVQQQIAQRLKFGAGNRS